MINICDLPDEILGERRYEVAEKLLDVVEKVDPKWYQFQRPQQRATEYLQFTNDWCDKDCIDIEANENCVRMRIYKNYWDGISPRSHDDYPTVADMYFTFDETRELIDALNGTR